MGAFASFTLGLEGAGGGFGQGLAGPANQNIYVGWRRGQGPWQLFPFFVRRASGTQAAFAIDANVGAESYPIKLLRGSDYNRELTPASDTWRHDNFRFSLHSPWGRTEDPSTMEAALAKDAFLPAIFGTLAFDNRGHDSPVELVWGVYDPTELARPLTDTDGALRGFAFGTKYGFATPASNAVELRQAFDILAPQYRDHRGLHLLGPECGLVWQVAANSRREFPLVLGFHVDGWVTTGIRTRYLYTRYFERLEDVLRHGLARHRARVSVALQRDREVKRAGLSVERYWLLSQAVHSYFGSTQLLIDRRIPLWAVNEGEYRMLNTFDLAVDQLFFELDWHPWAVRRMLELFVRRYSYNDRVHSQAGESSSGGISFTHDMGVGNHFTPPGRSSYECENLSGCFSHMSMEELNNWICCAAAYGLKSGDVRWLKRMQAVLLRCARSLENRDASGRRARDGLLKLDSSRCGKAGAEITTYDALDLSLGQARNNLYVGVKTQASWWLLASAFKAIGNQEASIKAFRSADLLAATLAQKFDAKAGAFPAVFEHDNQSRILPAVEGLIFPSVIGTQQEWMARYPDLVDRLRRHLSTSLKRGVCIDETSGAWKISSTSRNTWLSKVYLVQAVVARYFPEVAGPEAQAADRVHLSFSRDGTAAAFAATDQLDSTSGRDLGSRYYPRLVTSWLWLGDAHKENRRRGPRASLEKLITRV